MTNSDETLTKDAFLGGALHLWQPRVGYRAGVDPVLLAASVPAKAGDSVLDLGCGAGAAILCLASRVDGLSVTGIERQPEYAELAKRNANENSVNLRVVEADLANLPQDIRQERFDHVIANPPYFGPKGRTASSDDGREGALGEDTPLEVWFDVASRRLSPKGQLHMIHRTERLPCLLAGCAGRLGSIEVLPLAARPGRGPELLILRAKKGGRAAFRLHAPFVLHEGKEHVADVESYTKPVREILRNGAGLLFPD